MSGDTNELRRSTLQRKDRDELVAIATAMGAPPSSRARKAEIVELILTAAAGPTDDADASDDADKGRGHEGKADKGKDDTDESDESDDDDAEGSDDDDEDDGDDDGDDESGDDDSDDSDDDDAGDEDDDESGDGADRSSDRSRRGSGRAAKGADGRGRNDDDRRDDDTDGGNRRRRRRGRDRERSDDQYSGDPLPVSGHLDLRDEGYGFLRTAGFRPSRDDAYVSVRQVRQFGLRRGDHLVGACRPAGRNEKNPALVHIESVNGGDPEAAPARPLFDELTAVFPTEHLHLASADDPTNRGARIVDLVSPIGKGQRGLIEAGPGTGRNALIEDLARAVEANHPSVVLMVVLLDERPEDATSLGSALGDDAEVLVSPFDRPADEHIQLAELTIERAKRMAESGADVVVLVDGLTRLTRAYNLAGPSTGRMVSGIDSGAIYLAKRFFGAARALADGGSVTVLATIDVATGSSVDELIHDELRGTANQVLRLDRALADLRAVPAVDLTRSATEREAEMLDADDVDELHAVRRAVVDAAPEGDAPARAAALSALFEAMATHATNDELAAAVVAGTLRFS